MDLKEKFIGNTLTVMAMDLTSEQLQKLRNCLITQFQENDLIPHKELPSEEVIDNTYIVKHFLATKKMTGLSVNSLRVYTYHIMKFLNYCQYGIEDITTNHIRRYLAELGLNNTNTYVDDVRRVLNSFFTFCEDEEYITKNPCKKIDKIKQKKVIRRTPYTDMEVELLREACKTKRDLALIDFLLSTGCRRDEVRKVKLSDINLTDRTVIIEGKGSKQRLVAFSARCELHLREYLGSRKCDSEYLFCADRKPFGQLSCGGLACIVKRIGERAGVDNVHLHRFRRWFATYMADHGVALQDLKEMLGHSKLDTTNIYVTANNQRIKTVHKNTCA